MTDEVLDRISQALEAIHALEDRAPAENFLSFAECNVPHYYPMLQHIYLSGHYDDTISTLAAITFKNGVDKYWRKTAKNAIPEGQKAKMRALLFEKHENLSPAVARQNSIAIARISRIDFPLDWPEMFQELLLTISKCNDDDSQLLKHMFTLHQVVKALCSLRLSRSRENFQQVADSLLAFVSSAYIAYSRRWMMCSIAQINLSDLQISDQALKIVRRLVCFGFEAPYRHTECRSFFALLAGHIQHMWTKVKISIAESSSTLPASQLIGKHLLHAGKFFLELSSNSMQNYVMNYNYVFMPNSMELVKTYWTISAEAAHSNDSEIRKVVIQGLILFKQCIKLISMPESHLSIMPDQDRQAIKECLQILKTELFAPESLCGIFETLITTFFVLREADLEEWKNSPEEWMMAQEGTHWQFNIRPCAERVLLDLFAQYRAILSSPLFNALQSRIATQSSQELLIKEALYNALGLVAPHLFDVFDFDAFVPLLQTEVSNHTIAPIFKRRILILISQWVRVKCSESQRSCIYQIILNLMRSESEIGLSLAAAFSVETIIEDWDWKVETFEPFTKDFIRCLARCLNLAEETESKMKVLSGIGLICERLGNKIGDEVQIVLQQLPNEWRDSEDQHLLKVAILGLLTRIVRGQKQQSQACYPVVLPLIQYSINPVNVEHIYLMEEGLELWHISLQYASYANDEFLQLLSMLLQGDLLPSATELLKKMLFIIESNVLLLAEALSQRHLHERLINALIAITPGQPADALSHIARVLGIAVQVWGARIFSEENIWQLSQHSLMPNQNAILDISYLCLLSELMLSDIMRMVSIWRQCPPGDITPRIIEKLVERFDNIGHSKHRKLCTMAVTCLIETGHLMFQEEQTLAWLGNIWGDTLAEIQANGGNDLVYWVDDSALIEDLQSDGPEANRRKMLSESPCDPVSTTHLRKYISGHARLVETSYLGVDLESLLH